MAGELSVGWPHTYAHADLWTIRLPSFLVYFLTKSEVTYSVCQKNGQQKSGLYILLLNLQKSTFLLSESCSMLFCYNRTAGHYTCTITMLCVQTAFLMPFVFTLRIDVKQSIILFFAVRIHFFAVRRCYNRTAGHYTCTMTMLCVQTTFLMSFVFTLRIDLKQSILLFLLSVSTFLLSVGIFCCPYPLFCCP